tara:strand:+ start:2476 stop:3216 length:741 start_codon:yes stop_codon:yes gene_type:complete
MSVRYNPGIVTEGLILNLDAADQTSYPGTGTTWTDLSSEGNNGTLEASTMGTVSASLQTIAFKGDSTVNDVTEHVVLPVADLKDYSQGSLEFVYKIYSDGYVSPGLLTFGDSSPNNWLMFQSNNDDLVIKVTSGGSVTINLITADTAPAIERGKFFHVVFTSDASTNKVYVNGVGPQSITVLTGSNNGTWFSAAPSPSRAEIGHLIRSYTSHPMEGEIPICRIYDRALSDTEVRQNFNAQRTRFGM